MNSSLSVFRPNSQLYTLPTLISLKSYDLKMESFCFLWVFVLENISIEDKIHNGLFLSLAITGIDVNYIVRYPSNSLKYHLTSILSLLEKKH